MSTGANMNQVLRDIMEAARVDAETAELIRHEMDCSGFDYSECTADEFHEAVLAAFAEVQP